MSSGITPIIATPQTLGHVGLDNIGNTCYINSSLQVLAHTELLFQYFESGLWRRELNEQNPKGTGGIVAHQFAQLINDIWTKKQKVISPYDLKNSIGKFHPQFNNSQQQDSQEFLLCLLSDLSGDLNRVTKRCYIEGVVGDGTNDNETADLAWKRHKLLFDSAIVDIFHGQLRTEVKCDECGNKKVVFDAYSSLSIPISKTNLETIRYMYIPADLKRPRYIVKILVSED
ncbi:ubiquitinyl hydrolase protein [Trichomonas vaginalis G3]|uniref:ubiquitinyl hydrolase protein n=1 Tax=Trichomonas vaginalis (strain ATCC PRA-98 / G3) TaxID=412133 RepID=UPI0021E5404B|nr:ubiquitinyl hydrolase protein [Trichomonas vaginalis G3]KAI5537795.1 ubiquitinyl hydrolase protein [Trichomonas vaginalis G3]